MSKAYLFIASIILLSVVSGKIKVKGDCDSLGNFKASNDDYLSLDEVLYFKANAINCETPTSLINNVLGSMANWVE